MKFNVNLGIRKDKYYNGNPPPPTTHPPFLESKSNLKLSTKVPRLVINFFFFCSRMYIREEKVYKTMVLVKRNQMTQKEDNIAGMK